MYVQYFEHTEDLVGNGDVSDLLTMGECRSGYPFPSFEKDSEYDDSEALDATAVVFSPDGLTLYAATTSREVVAISSDGTADPHWSAPADDDDLCDIAVSPDGWSVSMGLRSSRKQKHFARQHGAPALFNKQGHVYRTDSAQNSVVFRIRSY